MTIRFVDQSLIFFHEYTNNLSFFCLKIMNKPDLNREYSCICGKKILVQVTEGHII